jgi:hypothetical protein
MADCIMTLKSRAPSKQIFHILDDVKGSRTFNNLSLIGMHDMDAWEVDHNLVTYLAHHNGIWV